MSAKVPPVRGISKLVREKVKSWVSQNEAIDQEDLCGACAIASVALCEVLRHKGYKATLMATESENMGCHFWVEVSGYIIDITATQFGGPQVAIFKRGSTPDWSEEAQELYKAEKPLKNKAALSWSYDWGTQSPKRYKRHLKEFLQEIGH